MKQACKGIRSISSDPVINKKKYVFCIEDGNNYKIEIETKQKNKTEEEEEEEEEKEERRKQQKKKPGSG